MKDSSKNLPSLLESGVVEIRFLTTFLSWDYKEETLMVLDTSSVIPAHVCPSNVRTNPSSQVHSYEPIVLVHPI